MGLASTHSARPENARAAEAARRGGVATPTLLRGALWTACAAAALTVSLGEHTAPSMEAELVDLLRAMALLKAAIVLAAFGLLSWRFGHPTSPGLAASYLGGAWTLAVGWALLWRLDQPLAAALAFHAALAVLFVAALWDGRERHADSPPSPPRAG